MSQRLRQISIPAARAAFRSSKDSLLEQELKHITDPIQTHQPLRVASMELAYLIWNSEMHCIYVNCRTPSILPIPCDGCGGKFSIAHGLERKKGGSLETSSLLHSGRAYHESSWTIQHSSETRSSSSFH